LLLCSSYLPLGVPNWVVILPASGGLRVPVGERALEKSKTVVRVPAVGARGVASDGIVQEVWEEEGRRRPLRKEKRKKALAVVRGPCFL
jgi:hypothetical protein